MAKLTVIFVILKYTLIGMRWYTGHLWAVE